MSNKDNTPHAQFFEAVMGRRENARDLLRAALPQKVQEHLDLSDVYVEKDSFVDEKLRQHFADLVCSVNLKQGGEARVYCLLEHKSSPEALVGLQILRYATLEWHELYLRDQIFNRKLPPIIPVVIYQGERQWHVSREFHDIVDLPSEDFRAFIPNFSFLLWDVSAVEESELRDSLILRYFVMISKVRSSPELREKLPELVEALRDTLSGSTALEYIEIFFKYLARASDVIRKEDFEYALNRLPSGGEAIMGTLAEQWEQEGYERAIREKGRWISEGEQRGEQNMLIEALQEKFGTIHPELVGKIRSISSTEALRGLFKQALKKDGLKEFTGEVDKLFSS